MKSPAFRFYATDWLGSQRVQMLTLEQEGAYIRLIAYCWQHGTVPSDPTLAAKLIGKGASTTLARVVLAMFQPSQDPEKLIHDRLELERSKQRVWSEKSAIGGKKSAELRKGGSTTVGRVVQPSVSVSASVSLASTERPSLKEVTETAQMIGLAEWKASDWWNEMQAGGWLDYNHRPIMDWRAAMTRVRTKWESDGRPSSPPKPRNNHDSKTDRPNPRNAGIIRGPTNYATAKPRLQREREEAELAAQVASAQANPSQTESP